MFAVLLALSLPPAEAHALEPYLSVRTGLACAACHTNRTGGGNRTVFGNIWAQTQLPARSETIVPKELTEFLRIGFDLRAETRGFLASGGTPRSELLLDVAQLYLEGRFLDNRLVFYVDETLGPINAYPREAFLMAEALPGNGYVKAGIILLPYGWRLQDDSEYIRTTTGFNYFRSDMGAEVGFAPGPLQFALAVTNGRVRQFEDDDGKQVTTQASLVFPRVRIGASASRNENGPGRYDVVGAFGGIGLGPLTLLGEVDLRRDVPDPATAAPTIEQLMWYAEADWLLRQGVNAKATFGLLDPDRDSAADDQQYRLRLGLEWFPAPFLRFGGFYQLREDELGAAELDRVTAEAQLHF